MTTGDDRVVRVFVSSTFRDMHAERDHLNRFVFPEIRARCLRLGWDFLGVDLRWGITEEEAEQKGALVLCLAEVDRCRPFFVGLLGERYGTVLPPAVIPREVFERVSSISTESERRIINATYRRDETAAAEVYRLWPNTIGATGYDWRALAEFWERHDIDGRLNAGRSITAAEIEYAALSPDTRVQHCFFYSRRLQTPDQPGIPFALRRSLIRPAERLKVRQLQEQVRSVNNAAVCEYDAAIVGIRFSPEKFPSSAAAGDLPVLRSGALDIVDIERWAPALRQAAERDGIAELSGLESLGSSLLEDLWRAIEAYIQERATGPARPVAAAYQDAFVRQRTRAFVGRESTLNRLFAYVAGDSRSVLLVTGDPGSGKSALLANFALQCRSRHPDALVATHFIGASPDSTRLESAFAALCEHLGVPESEFQELQPGALLAKRKFQSILRNAALEREVIIILDALDQLEVPPDTAPGVWFPFVLPKGVHLVASSAPNRLTDALKQRLGQQSVVELENLTPEDRKALVLQHLALRQKRLPSELVEQLMDHRLRTDSRLPLYLLVATEEMCLFGSHEELGARIGSLPSTLAALLEQVLNRLEQDHGRELVRFVCSWLAVARVGLIPLPELIESASLR